MLVTIPQNPFTTQFWHVIIACNGEPYKGALPMLFCLLHTTETQSNSGAYFSPLQKKKKMKLKDESEESLN